LIRRTAAHVMTPDTDPRGVRMSDHIKLEVVDVDGAIRDAAESVGAPRR
jgi:hypothetical protein